MVECCVEENLYTGEIVDAAMKVHSTIGPGLLEGAYEACLTHELLARGLRVRTQVPMPVVYDGQRIDVGYRLDMLVHDKIIVELKATAKLLPVHDAQLLSYLRLSGLRVGLLLNFHESRLKNGIRPLVNRL